MTVRELHNQAMDTAIEAMRAHQLGEEEKSVSIYKKAFELENQAARLAMENEKTTDLTRSVLCRSAAWFAVNAELYEQAEQIAFAALNRGVHPSEERKIREVLCVALEKQGFGQGREEVENLELTVSPETAVV